MWLIPVFGRFGSNAKVVHFLGNTKPWSYTFDPKARSVRGDVQEASSNPSFLLEWWTVYASSVVPMMNREYGDQPFHSGCEVSVRDCWMPFNVSEDETKQGDSMHSVNWTKSENPRCHPLS